MYWWLHGGYTSHKQKSPALVKYEKAFPTRSANSGVEYSDPT